MAGFLSKGERPLDWIGSSKKDFLAFPEPVKDEFGNALGLAQLGGTHPSAKAWKGQGPGVFELVEDHDGDTYRAIYAVRFREVVYMLHAFQKKSPKGVKTAKMDVDAVIDDSRRRKETTRLVMARRSADDTVAQGDPPITRGTGNVFADLGYPDAAERQTKLRLVQAINGVIARRRMTQTAAAMALSITQPKVSALANYRMDGFSVERLMVFLTALDQDVEISIRKKPRNRATGRISVMAAE